MTESGAAEQSRDDDQALRRRLLMRIAGAAAVMAGLLAGLLVFDALVVKPDKPAAEKTAALAEPAKPEVPAGEPAKSEEAQPAAEADKPTVPPPPPPEVAAVPEESSAPEGTMPPAKPERPLTVPARPHAAIARPTGPTMILPPLLRGETPGASSRAAAPTHPTPPTAPTQPTAAVVHAAEPPLAGAMAAAKRFLVQVGVFSSLANAEELRAKLELAGIPAQIEARVHVGPFASREEAEQARAKLRELGVEHGLVMTRK